jgi:anti-sigma B factor antagonist
MAPMDLQIEDRGILTAVRLHGELSGPDSDQLVEALHDRVVGENARVAVDLSGLQSIDSSGLAALMNLVTRARLGSGQIVLVAPTPFVAGVFNVTHLDTWFDICNTIEEAAARFES